MANSTIEKNQASEVNTLTNEVNTLKGAKPSTLIRPLTEDCKTKFSYTAPHDGVLYLTFVGTDRVYCLVNWNRASIGSAAFPAKSSTAPTVVTETYIMKKSDLITVDNLGDTCWLSAGLTAFIANASDI